VKPEVTGIVILARIRRDDDAELDQVMLRSRSCYHPRNLHYRRPFWPIAKDLILKYVVWFVINAAGAYLVLRLLGVV
jgi:hypothetical protein